MTTTEHKFKQLAISKIHQFDGYCIFMREGNIIHLHFEPGFNGDLEDAKIMVDTFKKLKGKDKALVLVIYEEDNMFSKEARDYVASDEVSQFVKADALIIKGLALRIIGNGYLKINKPNRPTRLFNSADDALDWLKQFRE